MLSFESFLAGQPCAPEEKSTDRYYYGIACRLIEEAKRHRVPFHESQLERAALCVTGYYQDVIADAGLWHGFVDECMRLYGVPVPFFDRSDDYIDYELNREDVGFLVWYSISMYSDRRCVYPFDSMIVRLADLWYSLLEEVYEESPVPDGYHLAHELDVYDEGDREMIMRLGGWLYLHSWLLRPAFALTAGEIISEARSAGKNDEELAEELQNAVEHQPTGPLALYIGEWVHLTVNHRLPSVRQKKENKESHPSYALIMEETGGYPLQFIQGYEAFNEYLIRVLGWKAGENHLEQLRGCRDFVVMSNREKGLLVATDICRNICAPHNPLYVREYARRHAMELLTERGACPHDLLSYICDKGWLPDAVFSGSDDNALVMRYHDFIARCYLQLYYRGD